MSSKGPRWNRAAGYAMSLTTGTLAGLLYAVNKALSHDLTAMQITCGEAFVAVLILLPAYLWRTRRQAFPAGLPWGWLLTFGGTAVMLFYARTLGIALTNPTTGSLVVRLEVGLVFIYSFLFLREKPSAWGWAGAGLLLAGMLAALDLPNREVVLSPLGIVALVGCAFGIASNAIIIKLHLGRVSDDLTALVNVSCQAAVFGLLLPLTGQLPGLKTLLVSGHDLVLILVGGGIVTWMLTTYYYAMKRIPMWTVRLLGLVTPAAALLADHFWLKSPITTGQILGLALVTAGSALVIIAGVPALAQTRGVDA